MSDFILYSIIGSVVLTVVLNVLPLLFPNAADKLQRKIEENARRSIEQHQNDDLPKVKVFFPWKAMLIASVVLTVVLNLIGFLNLKIELTVNLEPVLTSVFLPFPLPLPFFIFLTLETIFLNTIS